MHFNEMSHQFHFDELIGLKLQFVELHRFLYHFAPLRTIGNAIESAPPQSALAFPALMHLMVLVAVSSFNECDCGLVATEAKPIDQEYALHESTKTMTTELRDIHSKSLN